MPTRGRARWSPPATDLDMPGMCVFKPGVGSAEGTADGAEPILFDVYESLESL